MSTQSSSAPAAKLSKRAQRSLKSTWKSVPSAILSSQASRNWSIRPDASNDSKENIRKLNRGPEACGSLRQLILILKHFNHFILNATSWALSSSDDILVGGQ